MERKKRHPIRRIFILLLLLCAAASAWAVSRGISPRLLPDYIYIMTHRQLYTEHMLSSLGRNPELTEFLRDYPTAERAPSGGITCRSMFPRGPAAIG